MRLTPSMRAFMDERNRDIAEMLRNGSDISEVCKKHGLGPAMVRSIASAHGVSASPTWKYASERDTRMVEAAKAGRTVPDIAAAEGITAERARQILRSYGVKARISRPKQIDPERDAALIADYVAKVPMCDILSRYNITRQRIHQILIDHGIPTRELPKPPSKYDSLPIDEIIAKNNAGTPLTELAKEYQCRRDVLLKALDDRGVSHHNLARKSQRILSDAQVAEIWWSPEAKRVLAQRYGVSMALIQQIRQARQTADRVIAYAASKNNGHSATHADAASDEAVE